MWTLKRADIHFFFNVPEWHALVHPGTQLKHDDSDLNTGDTRLVEFSHSPVIILNDDHKVRFESSIIIYTFLYIAGFEYELHACINVNIVQNYISQELKCLHLLSN